MTRTRAIALGVGAVSVGSWVLWRALSLVLATDRGLDTTDEGLYLLAADSPGDHATWGFPWGWHTGPLFRLVGHDIAAFRTLGAFLLVLAGAWVGWEAVRTARDVATSEGGSTMDERASAGIGALVGGLGVLLYYAGLLRSPSYNWLNLFGILVAAAATISLSRRLPGSDLRHLRWLDLCLAAAAALGLFLTIPAKPSTAPIALLAGLALLGLTAGLRRAATWTATVAGMVAVWILIAVVVRVWPTNFARMFRQELDRPSLSPSHTVSGAAKSAREVPTIFREELADLSSVETLMLVAAVILTLVALTTGRAVTALRMIAMALVAVSTLAIARVPLPLSDIDGPISRFAHTPTVTACLVLVLGAAAVSFDPDRSARESGALYGVVAYLVLLPFVFGFGSTQGTYTQAGLGAGIFLVAAVAALTSARCRPARLGSASLVAMCSVILTGVVLAQSHQMPYRLAPIDTQDERVVIGGRGASLRVDTETAADLSSLVGQAEEAGWRQGTPLIGVAWRWSSGVPYVLGAGVPDSLMLTLFGYEGSQAVAEHNLSDPSTRFPFAQAWILTTPSRLLDQPAIDSVIRVLDAVETRTDRSFPADYDCVAHAGESMLWRPSVAASNEGDDIATAESSCPAPRHPVPG